MEKKGNTIKKSDLIITLVLAVAALAPPLIALSAPFPWLQDYPEWVYQSWLVPRLAQGSVVTDAYRLAGFPVPNATLLFVCLWSAAGMLGWIGAARWLLVVYCLLFFIGLRRLWNRMEIPHSGLLTAIAIPLLVVSNGYWNGFISYQLSLLVLIWFLGLLDRDTGVWLVILFSVLSFFAHLVGWIILSLFLIYAVRVEKFPKKLLLGLTPTVLLLVWYTWGRLFLHVQVPAPDSRISSWIEFVKLKGYIMARTGPFHTFLLETGTSALEKAPWLYDIGFVSNFLFAIGIAGLAMFHAVRFFNGHRHDNWIGRAAQLLGPVFLICHLTAPYDFIGLFNIGERLLIPIAVLMIAAAPPRVHKGFALMIVPVFLITLAAYGNAILNSPPSSVTDRNVIGRRSTHGVQEYNSRVFASSDQKYFNHRIRCFRHRVEAIENREFQNVHLTNGLIVRVK